MMVRSGHELVATFKAFVRSLPQATEYDPRRRRTVPRFDIDLSSLNHLQMQHFQFNCAMCYNL